MQASVKLALWDDEVVTIPAHDVSRVCENLLAFAPNLDAMVLVGVLIAEARDSSLHFPLDLTAPQSALMRQAMAKPEAA